MSIAALVVDDEPIARHAIVRLLRDDVDIEVLGECGDGASAVAAIRAHSPDLVFIDIQMPAMNGIDVVAAIGADRMPATVFVTAYEQYAVRAFEANAVDYLVKPFSRERFLATLRRVKARLAAGPAPARQIRIDVRRLDNLMNLVGELVIARGRLAQIAGELGDAALVERMRPLLGNMGRAIHHGGPLGAGQTLKLCNNMLLGILMAGTSEALRLGIANGLDPKVLSAVMQQSSGRNWTLEVYNPCPGVMENAASSRGYTGGFATDLMAKDLRLAHGAALASDVATPLGDLARRIFEVHRANGHGGLDFSSIFQDPVTLAQALDVK